MLKGPKWNFKLCGISGYAILFALHRHTSECAVCEHSLHQTTKEEIRLEGEFWFYFCVCGCWCLRSAVNFIVACALRCPCHPQLHMWPCRQLHDKCRWHRKHKTGRNHDAQTTATEVKRKTKRFSVLCCYWEHSPNHHRMKAKNSDVYLYWKSFNFIYFHSASPAKDKLYVVQEFLCVFFVWFGFGLAPPPPRLRPHTRWSQRKCEEIALKHKLGIGREGKKSVSPEEWCCAVSVASMALCRRRRRLYCRQKEN